jgi:phosphopantothenoylcysteine decarboxylase/phosphopantothenate--cysteine ligase
MASLTIRKLDDAIRDELRLRAARNGRSVEDEVRVILREASQNQPLLTAAGSQTVPRATWRAHAPLATQATFAA